MRAVIARLKRYPILYDFARHQIYARVQSARRRAIFEKAFRGNLWDGTESVSGIGSSAAATEHLRAALPGALKRLGITTMLDVPCGDAHWMSTVPLGKVRYTGADLVRPLIEQNKANRSALGEFVCLDLLRDALPPVDLVFCRDCLVHLSLRDARRALDNIMRAKPRYLMTTTFPECKENTDTVAPYWRPLNMLLPPFDLPEPVEYLTDRIPDQFIGVWRLRD
ncbi:MAG: class I SAM-dependent methyltransferase [Pseudolabrys sp.]